MRMLAGVVALVLGCGMLGAQVNLVTEYPSKRVRMVRPEGHAPEPFYERNRVIFKRVDFQSEGSGTQISGEIWVDFECDRPPSGSNLPRGQIMGLRLDVQLQYHSEPLRRNRDRTVQVPRVDATTPGRAVEGQFTQAMTSSVVDNFGVAPFRLPATPRPLAPGVYKLVATLEFRSQGLVQRQSIKWCSDCYGAKDDFDPVLMERVITPVFGNEPLHEEVYQNTLEVLRRVEDTAIMYVGDVAGPNQAVIRGPANASERQPANFALWTHLINMIEYVEQLEPQTAQLEKEFTDFRDNTDAQDRMIETERRVVQGERESIRVARERLNADLRAAQGEGNEDRRARLEGQRLLLDEREKGLEAREKAAAELTRAKVIQAKRQMVDNQKKNVQDLIAQYGGRTERNEVQTRAAILASRAQVLVQIADFQDRLTERYWVLIDGQLLYAGWHTVNRPGSQMFEAVKNDDTNKDRERRMAEWGNLNREQQAEVRAKRDETWKYQAPDIRRLGYAYLDRANATGDFDSTKFTRREGRDVIMNVEEWGKYRQNWMTKFLEDTAKLMQEVDTSIKYANRVWPELYTDAEAARDAVISLAFSWEYYTRTAPEAGIKEDGSVVSAGFLQELGTNADPQLIRAVEVANVAPANIKTRFDAAIATIRAGINLSDFQAAYKAAIDAGERLPGSGR